MGVSEASPATWRKDVPGRLGLQSLSYGGTANSRSWLFKACKATCLLNPDEDTLDNDQRPTPVAACVGFTLTGDTPNA